ncbi:MAG: porphobilinogen synthase [Cytophagales bacterium]|nr:porphobilinogen synthase [Cytophagales bacterium]
MSFHLHVRPRRLRRNAVIRGLCAETQLSVNKLIYPLFVREGKGKTPIPSMPGQFVFSIQPILKEIEECIALGIHTIALFPQIVPDKKDPMGSEAYREEGIYIRALQAIKQRFPNLCLISDVALDPYSSTGHDGWVSPEGEVSNDKTLPLLSRMAVLQAQSGADIIAPSDMMDGRVGYLRKALDQADLRHIPIMSYSAKYSSSLYGPFRDALGSAPKGDHVPGDKKTYQINPKNRREATWEAKLDQEEGADILMVKPIGFYLDVLYEIRQITPLALAAYQVSGEYAMFHAAAERGWIDLRSVVQESLFSIRRAGADMIISYFAKDFAVWNRKEDSPQP